MEASIAEKGAVEQRSDAAKTPAQTFRWAEYLHVGDGAADCEHATDGRCENNSHVHAWCRLPNQFQHADIRKRALAAKARTIRRLRDPDSDEYTILEADLDELRRHADTAGLVEELVAKDWWKDHLQAMREIADGDDAPYAHIEQDRERLEQLDAMDPLERNNDEREELQRHLAAYNEAIQQRRDEIQRPRREALAALSHDELIDQVRDERIQAEASGSFMDTYSKWEWFAGTLRPVAEGKPTARVYHAIEDLENEEPTIIDALRRIYGELEGSLQRGPAGNS